MIGIGAGNPFGWKKPASRRNYRTVPTRNIMKLQTHSLLFRFFFRSSVSSYISLKRLNVLQSLREYLLSGLGNMKKGILWKTKIKNIEILLRKSIFFFSAVYFLNIVMCHFVIFCCKVIVLFVNILSQNHVKHLLLIVETMEIGEVGKRTIILL